MKKQKTLDIFDLIEVNKKDIKKYADNRGNHYLSFPLTKSNGKRRWIDAPDKDLKGIQKDILHKFIYTEILAILFP